MNGELPLSDRDFTDIRKAVMRTIETRRTRRVRIVRTVFAIVAVLISRTATTPDGDSARRSRAVQPPSASAIDPGVRTARLRRAESPPHKQRHRRPPAKYHEPEPIRIELATADPDIRIIWITNTL